MRFKYFIECDANLLLRSKIVSVNSNHFGSKREKI